MKRIVAGIVTAALMGGLLWSGSRRPAGQAGIGIGTGSGAASSAGSGGSNQPDPAELRLKTLLDGALRGDVTGYLACFEGPLRERLEREVNERGRDNFAADLRRTAGARKSHAVFAVEPEGEGAARITVETVYPDRNERQTYHLTRESSSTGWLVSDVETVRSLVPKARFGTQASYQEPEGAPVQGLVAQGVPLRVDTGTDADADANAASVAGEGRGPIPATAP
jgi:hypothetical protein